MNYGECMATTVTFTVVVSVPNHAAGTFADVARALGDDAVRLANFAVPSLLNKNASTGVHTEPRVTLTSSTVA